MTLLRCGREKEIAALIKAGHWPAASGEELRAHAALCRRCGELVLVKEAFQAARASAVRESAVREAKLDSPGLLWWRAQLRRRNEAVERIGRPVTGAQVFALAVNLVVAVGLIVAEWRNGAAWFKGLAAHPKMAEGLSAGPGAFGQAVAGHNIALQAGAGQLWQTWFEQVWSSGASAVSSVAAAAQGVNSLLLVLSMAAFAVLGGVAVYLATEKEPQAAGEAEKHPSGAKAR
jgi:hypothetical protein